MLIRVDLATFPLGKTLAKDLYSSDGRLLMPRGIILKEFHLQQLLQRGYEHIFVLEDESSSSNSGSSSKNEDTRLPEVFSNTVENIRDMMAAVSAGHMVKPSEVNESIDILLPEVTGTNNVMKHLLNLRNKDEYTLQHSVSVGVMSIKIGQAMKLSDKQLKNLGIAGLLHDIGKCKIPIEIINKPGPLNEEEFKEIQNHPIYGYRIVNDIKLPDPDISTAVLQHHEHQDGHGYPLKAKGKDITLFANIIAVADVFDALTSDRAYRPKMPLLKAIDHIVKSTLGHLEPMVARRLFTYILDISIGETVLLNNGEKATVVLINELDPTRPLVRIGDKFIDLKTEKDIFIQDLLT
ncbi:MAG: HD-GYP domain-containing protein [Syntrophomonadaceae bacterium]|nr:HD-GYP domain-containing protein [Syntrophomonadaceae bacterium]